MLSIQIDTKSLELLIYHQFNNIKLSFFASHMKLSFPLCSFNRCCTVIRYSRVGRLLLRCLLKVVNDFRKIVSSFCLWQWGIFPILLHGKLDYEAAKDLLDHHRYSGCCRNRYADTKEGRIRRELMFLPRPTLSSQLAEKGRKTLPIFIFSTKRRGKQRDLLQRIFLDSSLENIWS